MLADNQTLVCLGDWLYKLKLINQRPYLLAVDQFYTISLAVIHKASPEDISPGGVLIVDCILETLRINNNKIISRIPNVMLIPYSLQSVVNKAREDKFMSITGFVYNYPCRMS